MAISVRLDRKTEAILKRLARQRSKTTSEIVRESLALFGEREEQVKKTGTSLYERISHLVGCAKGGPRDLASHAKEQVRRMLAEKQERRRAR